MKNKLDEFFYKCTEEFNKDVTIVTEKIANYILETSKDELAEDMYIYIIINEDGECILDDTTIFSAEDGLLPEYTFKVLQKAIEKLDDCEYLIFEETDDGFELRIPALYE